MKKTSTRHPGLFRRSDGRYFIRTTAKCERTGKLKEVRKTLPVGTSMDQALGVLAELKGQLREGVETRPTKQVPSLTDFGVQWLEVKAARVRPSTADNYRRRLETFILPQLGDTLVDQLTRMDMERFVAWLEQLRMPNGKRYTKDTVQGVFRVTRTLIRDAVAEYNLPDPTFRVRPPSPRVPKARESRTLSAPQVRQLLGAVRRFSPDRYAEVYMLALTGMRSGELYALKWEDLDHEGSRILVRRSVWHGHLDATKTVTPREVAFTPEMARILASQREKLVSTNHPGLGLGVVFPTKAGTHRMGQSLHKTLRLATEATGIDIKVTPQVLRRTHNTLALAAGVDRITLRSQMGHSSEELTERYAGVPITAKHDLVARLTSMMDAEED